MIRPVPPPAGDGGRYSMFRPRQEPQTDAPRWFLPSPVPLDHSAYLLDDEETGADGWPASSAGDGHPPDPSGYGPGMRYAEVTSEPDVGEAEAGEAKVDEAGLDGTLDGTVVDEACPGELDEVPAGSSEGDLAFFGALPGPPDAHQDGGDLPEDGGDLPEDGGDLPDRLDGRGEPADGDPADGDPADGDPADGDPADGDLAGAGAVEPEPAGEPAALPGEDADPAGVIDRPTDVDEPFDATGIPGSAAAAAAAAARLDDLNQRVEELARLRRHDADLVDRLHAENTRLRAGELTEAMAPLLRGLMRLHDQMTSLGADDGQSVAGILRKQLLQILDVAADVRPYTAVPGMPFDPARHVGVRRVGTDDPGRDRTIARTVKPGFVRGGSTVVRPAEVEVFRAH